jgi:hypothetical protein
MHARALRVGAHEKIRASSDAFIFRLSLLKSICSKAVFQTKEATLPTRLFEKLRGEV